MKTLLSFLLITAFAGAALADIQEPPAAWNGPARKLGRGLSNILFGISELSIAIAATNDIEGNNALPVGITDGLSRTIYRFGAGWYEVMTFPFPTFKETYRMPYEFPESVWGHTGFAEFPPELGFETRYHYCRYYNGR